MSNSVGDRPVPPSAPARPMRPNKRTRASRYSSGFGAIGLFSPCSSSTQSLSGRVTKQPRVESPLLQFDLNGRRTALEAASKDSSKSIDILIAGQEKAISKVEDITGEGSICSVYKFTIQGEGDFVIKLNRRGVNNSYELVDWIANTLIRYAQHMEDPLLKEHTVSHLNLDPIILKEEFQALMIKDRESRYKAIKEWVKENVKEPYFVAQYVPNAFPEKIDVNSNLGRQLKTMLDVGAEKEIEMDLHRSNLRVDEKGRLQLVDIYELDGSSEYGDFILEQAKRIYESWELHEKILEKFLPQTWKEQFDFIQQCKDEQRKREEITPKVPFKGGAFPLPDPGLFD